MEQAKITCLTCRQINRLAVEKLPGKPRCGTCGDPLITGGVAELDPVSHDKAIRNDEVPILVDYWAPWCGPCRTMAPEFLRAAKSLAPWVRLAKLNTQDHPAIATRSRIQGIPLLILYHRGKEMGRLAGARPARDIVAFVQTTLEPPAPAPKKG
ncbi:thioredoxin family protein [Falsigemmobacter faecalis]|uniref:Thiol reductase thioredoxin n=1 Tax=Falsigemmobacter faecalis TaxID=2488730 RepID=A0A3P3DCC9_9RHOB|nr:thioredoxin domain-containing protein [Falsigemmobacter faecalis]RRH71484.1 thiol reductase thioredoxin [Falsigemmobacter faecalis]